MPAGALAHVGVDRVGRVAEGAAVHQRVVEHQVGRAQTVHRAQREQLRIAGTGADEGDEAGHATSA